MGEAERLLSKKYRKFQNITNISYNYKIDLGEIYATPHRYNRF